MCVCVAKGGEKGDREERAPVPGAPAQYRCSVKVCVCVCVAKGGERGDREERAPVPAHYRCSVTVCVFQLAYYSTDRNTEDSHEFYS